MIDITLICNITFKFIYFVIFLKPLKYVQKFSKLNTDSQCN